MSISGRKAVAALAALALSLLAMSTASAIDDEAQAAKDEGMRLYNAHQRTTSMPYLEIAANAGDVEAMYYLGEAHRLRHLGMTQAALDWYHMAAQEGDPYAMLRLESGNVCKLGNVCPDEGNNWAESALTIVLPQAENGDAEAMGTLFHVYLALGEHTEAVDWLKRAAEAGDPISQHLLGVIIQEDESYIPDEAERLETAEEWARRAAEQEHVPAMDSLSIILKLQGKNEEAWEWMLKASENGHFNSRFGIGWCYLEPNTEERCQNEKDLIKGWAILTALVKNTGNSSAKGVLDRRQGMLNDEQLREAEELAKEWMEKEPPLSQYPPKYGF